jgi:hypothetical protein
MPTPKKRKAVTDKESRMTEAWKNDATVYKKWLREAIEDILTAAVSEDGMDGSVADKWNEVKGLMKDPPPDRATRRTAR